MKNTTLRMAVAAAAASAIAVPALASAAQGDRPADSPATIRQATAKYHDPAVALADGYLPTDECVASPEGVMGYHYVKPELAMQAVDIRRPAILIYQPTEEGRKLVAVEYFQADADQDLSTSGDRPSILGVPFEGPMDGHGPDMPVHYDLHAWVWQHNPSGMFQGFNPKGSC